MITAKQMAYNGQRGGTDSQTFRNERSVPFMRRGINLPAIPAFKGLPLYPQSASTVPPAFQQTVINTFNSTMGTRTRWPIGPAKQIEQKP